MTTKKTAVKREAPEGVRLQKILADAGIASRRKAEEIILEGRVQVNGQTITELGTRAVPGRDHVRLDGKLIETEGAEHRYFVLNKPRGYVTTLKDPEHRPTIMDLIGKLEPGLRLYPIGRLDYASEGLLLMTNDGELANALSKASSSVEKTYLVKVAGQPSEEGISQLRRGVMIDRARIQEVHPGSRRNRVMTAPARITQVRRGDNPWFEVTLTEGRNRQLRKMFEEIGHHVEKIKRTAYGALVLDVEPGRFRELKPGEVMALQRAAVGKKVERRRNLPEPAKLLVPGKKTGRRQVFSRYKRATDA